MACLSAYRAVSGTKVILQLGHLVDKVNYISIVDKVNYYLGKNNMSLRDTIFGLAQVYRGHIKEAVHANELGLNGMHVRCLHAIASHPDCTANDIVQRMDKDKAQIARLIKDMLDKGWIVKQASDHDKRSQILSLSVSGEQLQQHISRLEKEIEANLLCSLSAQEIAEFHRIGGKMLARLKSKP